MILIYFFPPFIDSCGLVNPVLIKYKIPIINFNNLNFIYVLVLLSMALLKYYIILTNKEQ